MRDDEHFLSQNSDELDWRLVDQYLAGTLDGEAAGRVEQWFTAFPEMQRELNRVRSVVAGAGMHRRGGSDPEVMLRRLRRRMEGVRPGRELERGSGAVVGRGVLGRGGFKPRPLRRGVWSIAAGLVFVTTVVVAGWKTGALHVGGHGETAVSTYTTANGERATITLPDGSTVALNVASRLEVPVDYSAGNHTLRLTGEALFTVLHHTDGAFTVISGPTTTRVLGTRFVVRRYTTDSTTTVAVHDGKVAIRALVLRANQQVEIGRRGASRVGPARAAQFSFATGVLTLDGIPLSDAIPELDRWYDVDVRLGNPALANQRLTGDVPAGSLAELSALLEWTFNMRVVREGRTLTLFPR